ncbi:MAG: AAC(3) family N-acetyltransferase [Lachnospira sp.]
MTKKLLINQLRDMGLRPSDKIMVHSSMKAIGEVEGGADTVVDAFMEYFKDGLFMTPAHTWKQMSKEYNIFDPSTEPGCVGIIPNIFMKREGVHRSLHPTHSIAAFGSMAEEYVKGDDNFNTPCNPKGCFGRLYDIDARILLIGVTHAKNTYIHSIEESLGVKQRFTSEPTLFYIKREDGTLKPAEMYRHFNSQTAHISESFDKLMDYYYETGAATKVRFGAADSILCSARSLYNVTKKVLSQKPDYFIPYTD